MSLITGIKEYDGFNANVMTPQERRSFDDTSNYDRKHRNKRQKYYSCFGDRYDKINWQDQPLTKTST